MGHTGALKGVVLTADSDENDAGGWHAGTGMLLPLANVPLIERILDAYERAGVRETLISAGGDGSEVAELCGNGRRWNMALTCADLSNARTPHEIVKEVAVFTGEAVFLATCGPVLLKAETYLRAVRMHAENGIRGIRLWERRGDASRDRRGSDGVYLLTPEVCGTINENGGNGAHAVSLGALLNPLAGEGGRMPALTPEDAPYDAGTPETYLDSNERLLASVAPDLEPPEIMADNFSSPNLVLRPPVILDRTAELERCRLGPGVCVGPGVRIGHGANIAHGVILAGADIGDGVSVSRAIIGKNVCIANRTVLHGRTERVRVVHSRSVR